MYSIHSDKKHQYSWSLQQGHKQIVVHNVQDHLFISVYSLTPASYMIKINSHFKPVLRTNALRNFNIPPSSSSPSLDDGAELEEAAHGHTNGRENGGGGDGGDDGDDQHSAYVQDELYNDAKVRTCTCITCERVCM